MPFINPLNAELNPICRLLTLLGAHHILHVSRIRVNIVQYVSPWTSQYYFALFRFAGGLRQVNMLSYADGACMTIAVALFLKHVA